MRFSWPHFRLYSIEKNFFELTMSCCVCLEISLGSYLSEKINSVAIRCVNLILWLQIHLTDVFYWYLIPSNEKFEIQKFWVKWKILHVTSSLREKKFWKCPMTLILFRGHRGHQLDSQEYFHHVVTTCSLCPARAPKTVWIFTKNRHLSLISNFLALFEKSFLRVP